MIRKRIFKKTTAGLLAAVLAVSAAGFGDLTVTATEADEEVISDDAAEALTEEEIAALEEATADPQDEETAAALAASMKTVSEDTVIPNGISISGTDVSGKTVAEANQLVESYVSQYNDVQFTLNAEDRSVTTTAAELGLTSANASISQQAATYGTTGNLLERYAAKTGLENNETKDYAIALTANTDTAAAYLSAVSDTLDIPAQDNTLVRENGSFTFVEGTSGVVVDSARSATAIATYINEEWNGEDASIDLIVKEEEPKGDEEQLNAVEDLLGTFSTNYGSSASGRKQNIKTGTGMLNGTVLYPGEQISVYEAVSPMDAAHGYALAGTYSAGQTVDDFGGGICQVSTTLYNALIRAELQIDERWSHSMIVSYVQPSCDAAIAGNYKDLKFTNNLDYPIYIEGYADGYTVTFNIYGKEEREAGREVSFVSETLSTREAGITFQTSSSVAAGVVTREQGSHTGYTAQLWKIVTVNGVEQSREVFNSSSYAASNAIYIVGTGGASGDSLAAIQSAIASGNLSSVQTASANAAAAIRQAAADAAAAAAAADAAANADNNTDAGQTDSSETPAEPDQTTPTEETPTE